MPAHSFKTPQSRESSFSEAGIEALCPEQKPVARDRIGRGFTALQTPCHPTRTLLARLEELASNAKCRVRKVDQPAMLGQVRVMKGVQVSRANIRADSRILEYSGNAAQEFNSADNQQMVSGSGDAIAGEHYHNCIDLQHVHSEEYGELAMLTVKISYLPGCA